MADELRPNPFCGHAVMRDYVADDQWNDITGTESDTCGMCEEIFRMSDEDWNRRPIEDALRAEVERLKAELRAATVDVSESIDAAIRAAREGER